MSVDFSLQLQALFDLKQPFLHKKEPFLSENIWNQNRNAKTLGSRLRIVWGSESTSKPGQSRNWTRNRVLAMDSLGIGIGTEFLDWTVSEPESESKKLEPGTSVMYHFQLFRK